MTIPIGSWGEILGAVASFAAALISLWALYSAHQAQKDILLSNKEAEAREIERDRIYKERVEREKEREARESAGTLQVWWASDSTCKNAEEGRYGFIISNEGSVPTVFRSVEIFFEFKGMKGKTKALTFVPPGRYFYPEVPINIEEFEGSLPHSNNEDTDSRWLRAADDRARFTAYSQAES